MSGVARRGFLKLLGAAPVALPVAAREAASKAGISTLGLMDGSGPSVSYGGPVPHSEGDWVADTCKRVFSKAWEMEQREQMRRWLPQKLDPDLACSRSLSLSAALNIQRERNIERRIRDERQDAANSYKRFFKIPFLVEANS